MRSALRMRMDHAIAALAKLAAAAALPIAFALTPAVTAFAQEVAADNDARACAQIENDAQRLACYDRALRTSASATQSPVQASEPAARSVPRATTAPRAADAPIAPTAARGPVAGDVADAQPGPAAIVVVAIREMQGQNVMFTTDQGQVWIQTDGRRNYYPEVPFGAEIRSGTMNSYFLIPNDRGRSIRVRRTN